MNHILSLIHLTHTNESEIIRQVTALPCSYEYAATFYGAFNRYPTAEECRCVSLADIYAFKGQIISAENGPGTFNGASHLSAIDIKTLTNKKAP